MKLEINVNMFLRPPKPKYDLEGCSNSGTSRARAILRAPKEPGGRKTVYALILEVTALPRFTRESIL